MIGVKIFHDTCFYLIPGIRMNQPDALHLHPRHVTSTSTSTSTPTPTPTPKPTPTPSLSWRILGLYMIDASLTSYRLSLHIISPFSPPLGYTSKFSVCPPFHLGWRPGSQGLETLPTMSRETWAPSSDQLRLWATLLGVVHLHASETPPPCSGLGVWNPLELRNLLIQILRMMPPSEMMIR